MTGLGFTLSAILIVLKLLDLITITWLQASLPLLILGAIEAIFITIISTLLLKFSKKSRK